MLYICSVTHSYHRTSKPLGISWMIGSVLCSNEETHNTPQ